MSAVHDAIAKQAWLALPADERGIFEPFLQELHDTSWYPDWFADRSMPATKKAEIDPDADRFIYPPEPDTDDFRKILGLTQDEARQGTVPLRSFYLIEYYLNQAVKSLQQGNVRNAVKFCGVYSHVIADMAEPIHALDPAIVDIVVPPPEEHIGMELHANVEGLKAPVDITGYEPRILGKNPGQAVMGAFTGLVRAKRLGASRTVPIVQALYAGDREQATALSTAAQNASARCFADFMHTVLHLHANSSGGNDKTRLDLRDYPHAACEVDMLYRYRPMRDISLIPYSGGKSHPLALMNQHGEIKEVNGLGVVPFLGPPHTPDFERETWIEYLLVPGAYKTFRARVGLNPLFTDCTVRAEFIVLADNRELCRSPGLGPRDAAFELEADLKDATWLTLKMRYTRNATPEDVARLHCAWAGHGVWGEGELNDE